MTKNNTKKIPRLRFKGFSGEWEEKKFGEVTLKLKSYPLSRSYEVKDSKTKYIHYGDIHTMKNKIITSNNNLPHIKDGEYNYLSNGNIVLADASEDHSEIAMPMAILDINNENIVAGLHTIAIKLLNLDTLYLYYFMHTDIFKKFGYKHGTGMKVFGISYNELSKLNLHLASINEQQKIGSFFAKLDQLIDLQTQKLEQLKKLKRGYLQKMFPQKGETIPQLRFKGFSGEWKEERFGDVFNTVTDYVANGSFKSIRDNVKKYDTCNYAYMIRIADFNNNFRGPFIYTDIYGYNYLDKSKLKFNDLIMSNVGYVGKVFKVPNMDKPMTLAPNSILLRSLNYINEFMYHLMKTSIVQYKIKINSSMGAQEKINKTDFKNITSFFPSYKEQKKISDLLSIFDNIIRFQDNRLLYLKKLKTAYLQKMFE